MYFGLAKRMLFETDKRLLWKLAWNMGFKGWRSVQKHKKRLKQGKFFPPNLLTCSPLASMCVARGACYSVSRQPGAYASLVAPGNSCAARWAERKTGTNLNFSEPSKNTAFGTLFQITRSC